MSSASTPARVFLLGSRAAGKTCFLAGLAVLGQPDWPTPFQVHATGPTKRRLDELAEALHRQQWPAPTNLTEIHELTVALDGRVVELVIVDYPGEDLENELRLLEPERIETLYAHFRRAEAFLLLLDPARDVLPLDDATPDQARERVRRLDATLNAVRTVALQRGVAKGDEPPARDVAVVLTKADLHPELDSMAAARRFFRQHAAPLDGKLRQLARTLSYFPLSSVGAVSERMVDGIPRQVPAATLKPTGYERVFHWIARRHAARKHRRSRRAVWAIGALVAAGLLGYGGTELYRRQQFLAALDGPAPALDRLHQTREFHGLLDADAIAQKRLELVQVEIARCEAALRDARSEEGIEEVRKAIAKLEQSGVGSLANRVTDLKALADERRELLAYGRVRRAFEGKQPDFAELAQRYLKEFDHPGRRADVTAWLKAAVEEQRLADRLAVKQLRPFNAATLTLKAEKVHAYLERWGRTEDPDAAAAMRKAADLALSFTQPRTYMVRPRRSGDFSGSGYGHGLALFVGASETAVHVFRSGEGSRTANWTAGAVPITWRAGEPVQVQFRAIGWVKATDAALRLDESPLAILLLCGRQPLAAQPGWDGTFVGTPYVDWELEGVKESDSKGLRDYILPGDRW